MKIIITRERYNDVHTYTHVKRVLVRKKGWVFPNMKVDVKFAKGATSHYKGKEHDVFWEIDHKSNPGAGSSGCSKIEIYEDDDSLGTTKKSGEWVEADSLAEYKKIKGEE